MYTYTKCLNIHRSQRYDAYIYNIYYNLTDFLLPFSCTGVPGVVRPRHTCLVEGSRLAATASGLPK